MVPSSWSLLPTRTRSASKGDSGDAVICIHGPLGSDEGIGTADARISHGCIRLHERDLLRMRNVPPRNPIDIVS
jgi:hypothetical protein